MCKVQATGLAQVALQAKGFWGPTVTTSMSAKEMAQVSLHLSDFDHLSNCLFQYLQTVMLNT